MKWTIRNHESGTKCAIFFLIKGRCFENVNNFLNACYNNMLCTSCVYKVIKAESINGRLPVYKDVSTSDKLVLRAVPPAYSSVS
jgi:hypothetical protein